MVEIVKKYTDKSWHSLLLECCNKLDPNYKNFLINSSYLPTNSRLFNAFSMPKNKVKYILFGQDPYPREVSAIGVAFIDGGVKEIFSQSGLSKEVNRATSLRNFIKMVLMAENLIKEPSQEQIAKIDKSDLINSIHELKDNFEKSGVLLLNSALIFEDKSKSSYHAKMWQPFIEHLLKNIDRDIDLILFGNFAKVIEKKFKPKQKAIFIEHPYNNSFIENIDAHKIFYKMHLLSKNL